MIACQVGLRCSLPAAVHLELAQGTPPSATLVLTQRFMTVSIPQWPIKELLTLAQTTQGPFFSFHLLPSSFQPSSLQPTPAELLYKL